jgi:hypothetical protein
MPTGGSYIRMARPIPCRSGAQRSEPAGAFEPGSRADALMQLIRHELPRLPALPLSLPFPANVRLLRLCRRFLRKPSIHATIGDSSTELDMSPRAFTRFFRRETGPRGRSTHSIKGTVVAASRLWEPDNKLGRVLGKRRNRPDNEKWSGRWESNPHGRRLRPPELENKRFRATANAKCDGV